MAEFIQTFDPYRSLLSRYPYLASNPTVSSALPHSPVPSPSPPVSGLTSVDRPLLSSIVVTNRLARDPNAMMCSAEAGGGVCADRGCIDLHLEKANDPTGERSPRSEGLGRAVEYSCYR